LAEFNPVKPTTDQGVDRAGWIRIKIIATEHPVVWTSASAFEIFNCVLIEVAHIVYVRFEDVDLSEYAFIKISEPAKPPAVLKKLIGGVTKQMSFDLEDVPRLTDRLRVEEDPRLVRNFPEYNFQAILGLRNATRLPNNRLGPSNQSLEGHEFLIEEWKCCLFHLEHVVIQIVRGAMYVTSAGFIAGTDHAAA
jgi:hypothetical protein